MQRSREVKRIEMAKNEETQNENRQKVYERKRMYSEKIRNKALQSSNKPIKIPYKSPQTCGKAVRKVLASLPKSPNKKKAVIAKLAIVTLVDKASVVKKYEPGTSKRNKG